MDKSPLENWRKDIDLLDEQLLKIIAQRLRVVDKIGNFKKLHGIELRDEKRWQEILHSRVKKGSELKLSEDFIKKLYQLLHEYSLQTEENK